MTGAITDPDDGREAQAKAKDARAQRRRDLHAVLSTEGGRRFVWRVIDEVAGLHSGTYTGDAMESAYQEGRRSIGRELFVEVQQTSRELYLAMMAEQLRRVPELPPEPDEASQD